jgi:hypothetical protein
MYCYTYNICFLVDVISMYLQIKSEFGELILLTENELLQYFGCELRGLYKKGNCFIKN